MFHVIHFSNAFTFQDDDDGKPLMVLCKLINKQSPEDGSESDLLILSIKKHLKKWSRSI